MTLQVIEFHIKSAGRGQPRKVFVGQMLMELVSLDMINQGAMIGGEGEIEICFDPDLPRMGCRLEFT